MTDRYANLPEPLPAGSTDPLYLAVTAALTAETSMGEWFARDLARRLAPRISALLDGPVGSDAGDPTSAEAWGDYHRQFWASVERRQGSLRDTLAPVADAMRWEDQ